MYNAVRCAGGEIMTIAELRVYRDNIEELESIQLRLNESEVVTATQGSAGPPTYGKITRKEHGNTYDNETINLFNRQTYLENQNKEIKHFIFSIQKKRFRDALIYYCLNLDISAPNWQETAEAVKDKADGEALRKATDRYLKKFFKSVR